MQKNKYRVHSNTLLEIAQSRAFTEKDNIDERFDEEGKIKLVSDRVGADLTLSIIKTEDGIAYSVKWDDSEEVFKGWNMAWEEFVWCLGVVNKPIEEAAKKAAEEAKRRAAEEAAEKEAAEQLEEQEGQVEQEDKTVEETSEETTEETTK